MRSPDALIRDINDGILAVAAAKAEMQLQTRNLVAKMKEDGHDRQWGMEYIDNVCKTVDAQTATWARFYFVEAWPEEES